ncbi:MAG: DUF2190 family protein [Magnetococcales bacterium]|nr:DUF2190 family protein [Magnetococcales bacterium]
MNPILTVAFTAGATINPNRIVKFDATDSVVIQAAAATDAILGVANYLGAATGDRVDVCLVGLADVEYGGAITRGALLTSDANGKAVAAAPAAGVNNRIIGVAMVSGVSGDIAPVLINPNQVQG